MAHLSKVITSLINHFHPNDGPTEAELQFNIERKSMKEEKNHKDTKTQRKQISFLCFLCVFVVLFFTLLTDRMCRFPLFIRNSAQKCLILNSYPSEQAYNEIFQIDYKW